MKQNRLLRSLWIVLFALAIPVMVIRCSKSSSSNNTTGGTTQGNTISMANMSFSVTTLTVASGTTVTWTNTDNTTHTVTADDAGFDSGDIAPGATFSHKFTAAGTFPYHCKYHSMMVAKVIAN